MKLVQKILFLFVVFISTTVNSQIFDPVKWSFSQNQIGDDEVELIFTASIEEHWHMYSQFLENDLGPIPTSFNFDESKSYEKIGKTEEGKAKIEYDPNFEMDLAYFENKATFKQKIKVLGSSSRLREKSFNITGFLEFMVCDAEKCLPPTMVDFSFKIDIASEQSSNSEEEVVSEEAAMASLIDNELDQSEAEQDNVTNAVAKSIIPSLPNVDLNNPIGDCGEESKDVRNLWTVFFFGFIGGLVALLTPCVFPMIPLTVSFFTKGNQEQGKGIGRAVLYGFFIFLIYAILSIPFHFNTDPEVLNEIATSVWLNIIFFVVFVVFAISFFGYFEITLPSGLANKADSASNVGGVLGIFFMALTLALVSFSCTGPILGTVLGNALKNGPWPITAAMSGFGVALGLPFALFAAFPSVMNKLPQSGGWLNSVKVVLGFIELALAVKFLSNADLVEQWGLLKRETFFLIWIIIGIGLSAYLFGWIKFPHDSPNQKSSLFKKIFTSAIVVFTIYIAPGVLKHPTWSHDLLSGFPPPSFYSWYDKETFHAEFMDFESGMEEAQKLNKPVLLDFTGWACVNCRKMEETVWTVDEVKEKLEKDFVLISLYVDDKVLLPDSLQGTFEQEINGEIKKKRIRTIGNKWATFQTHVFNNNSQPYYVMLSPDGYLLGNPVGYTPDVEEYLAWLDCGLVAFEKLQSGEYKPEDASSKNEEDNTEKQSEIFDPVKWSFSANKISDSEYEVKMIGKIEPKWHVYSQILPSDEGPLPTLISFDENKDVEIVGVTQEQDVITHYDPNFQMDLNYFENEAVFTQKVKVSNLPTVLKGSVNYMVCDEEKCLPPTDAFFEIELK